MLLTDNTAGTLASLKFHHANFILSVLTDTPATPRFRLNKVIEPDKRSKAAMKVSPEAIFTGAKIVLSLKLTPEPAVAPFSQETCAAPRTLRS